MSIPTDANHAADALTRIAAHLAVVDAHGATVLNRMRDAQAGHPQAARWDRDAVANRLWCWSCQRDLAACHRAGLDCMGEDITGPSDPTGEAAIRPDVAAGDLRNLGRALGRIVRDADLAMRILAAYTPRPATEHERAATTNWNEPHCESHKRIEIAKGVPWWVEPRVNGSGNHYKTTVGGKLTAPGWYCAWCESHIQRKGCVPSIEELESNRAGKRIRCPHPDIEEDAA